MDALIKSYSLLGLHQKPSIRLLHPPFKPLIQQIIDHGGYPHIVSRPNKSPFEVLFYLEGPQLNIEQIRGVLKRTAKERQLPWSGDDTTRLARPFPIEKWEHASSHTISPLGDRKLKFDWLQDDDSGVEAAAEDEDDFTERERSLGVRRQRRQPAVRYIAGFETEAEAETFARYWHARSMEPHDSSVLAGDLAPIVHAELLW